jgi:tetratricopeptide (TPR) repeat protein
VAEVSGSKLGDAAGAYGSLEAAFLEQPGDRELWDRLADVAERAGQQRALATAYATVVEAGDIDDQDRLELAVRAARLYDDVLGQPEEAEPFHKRILLADPLNDVSFGALKEMYTSAERWDELQALYRKRIADTVDGEDKLDLLLQLCFLFEEILDRPTQAIEAYQQVLQLAPEHGAARRTLETLYERTERWRDLVELLRGNLDHAEGQERVDLMFRLGQLYETRLSEPGPAVDQYEGVLLEQPHHLRTQQALSRLIAVESERQRVAAILEPLYENQGAYRDLARVLEIQLEAQKTGGNVELLLRIGELHEQRTRDAEAAFSAYARAVEADPSSERAREALSQLADTRDAFRRQRAQVLTRALESVKDDAALQAELLLELAVLLDQFLGDRDAAERAYERLIELAPDDTDAVLTASRALEAIHVAKQDYPHLAVDLRRQVDLESDADLRGRLLVRLADLYENTLKDLDGAIDAHKRRLDLDVTEVDALRALERLYERGERWPALVDTLRAHVDVSSDDDERRALGRRVASLRDERLQDIDGAIAAYKDVLSSLGPDRETLRALGALYERGERHADLLETLTQEEDLTDDATERAGLQFRMAELMRLHTGDVGSALERYDEVLGFNASHAGALAALDAIMNDPKSELRLDAARLAAPRYEASGAYERLLGVLEVLQDTDDVPDKLAALKRAAEVADTGLHDTGRAFDNIARAVRAGIDDPSLSELLLELDRLADRATRFADYVSLLSEVTPLVADGELKPEMHRRIARTAQNRLHDGKLALEHFGKVLEDLPEDTEALDALEQLNESAGDYRALIAVLKQKAELALDPEQRRRLLARQADLYEQRLDEPALAIEVLQEIIADSASEAAYTSLDRLFRGQKRFEDLRALYEQQLDREIGAVVELRCKLARICFENLGDVEAALSHLRDALIDDGAHADSIALLETIMAGEGDQRSAAAEILEPIYLSRQEWPKLTAALEARIANEMDEDELKRLLTRLAQIHEDQLEDFDGAIDVYARLFREDPRDEDTWETLTRLAKVGGQWNRLGKILGKPFDDDAAQDESMARLCKYTGRIYAERVGNHHRAAQLFEKAVAFDSTDLESFAALEAAYRQTASHGKLLDLYTQQAELAEGDERRVALLHERAKLLRDVLERPNEAIATYRDILAIEPAHAPAIAGLEQLLTLAEDWPALADHVRAQIDLSPGQAAEIVLKLRLAELLETKLSDVEGAIDVYEDLARLDTKDTKEQRAMWALERLVQEPQYTLRVTRILEPIYRKLDQWKKLIAILEAQVELLDDDADRVPVLQEIGELHERRGRDTAMALHAWMRAFVREPGNDLARGNVDRLAAALDAWNELVQAYESALAKTDDALIVGTLLTTLARVHDEKRGDPRAAIATYERLAAHDASDPTPLDALESLHTMVGDWHGLTRVHARKVEQAFDAQERGELLRRMGSVYEDLINDRQGAIDAYKRAVAEDDADTLAYEALDRLYTAERKPEELAAVLDRRIDLAVEPAERVELGLRLGQVRDRQLHQVDQAIAAYQRVLDDDASNADALGALAVAFERQGMWSELLDNLSQQHDLAQSPAERVRLLYRSGDILEQRQGEVDQAIDRYRDALAIDDAFAPAIDALLRIARLSEHRARASEIVEPLLRAHGRFDDLVQLIEAGLPHLDDAIERRAELQRLAELHEHSRHQPKDAFDTLCRALGEDPADDALLADLERLARSLGAYEQLAKALSAQAGAVADSALSAGLFRRLGRIYEEELRDDGQAINAFVQASERDDEPETLLALDRLYERTQRWDGLLDVIERRIAATADAQERTDLLIRLGDLRADRFDDGRGAFVAFKEVLDGDPGEARALAGMERLGQRDALAHDVLDTLDECYRQVGAIEKLAGLYDIRIRLADSDAERIRLLNEAARIWGDELKNPSRALLNMRRVFEIDPDQSDALAEIEHLTENGASWDGVRGMIEGLIESGAVEGRQKKDLALRAAEWYRDRLGDPAAQERCLRWALEVDAQQHAVHEQLIDLLRVPGREAELAAALRAFADAERDVELRKQRLREAAEISGRALGDKAAAASSYEALLDVDPDDRDALAELAAIRSGQGRWKDVIALLERQLGLETDADMHTVLRSRIAQTYETDLGDVEQAIAAYRAVLKRAPEHEPSLFALERLYEQGQRWDDLRALLEQKRDRAPTLEQRSHERLRLAKLSEERLGDRARAMGELSDLVREQPTFGGAQDELQRLYTEDARWPELVELLRQRAQQAADAGDAAGEIAHLQRLADVYESQIGDRALAIETYTRIEARDERHRPALEALLRLLLAAERWPEAAQAANALLSQSTGEDALALALRLAELADQRLNDLGLAESALLHAQDVDPNHAESRKRLRDLYEKQRAYEKLVQLLAADEQQTAEPAQKLALLNRLASLCRTELNDPGTAVTYLERAVALVPDDREALLSLCDLYIAADRSRDAIPVLEKIIESYGTRRAKEVAVYHHRLGQAYEGLGELDEALKRYDAAFKIDLTSVPILRDLGRLCLAKNDLDRAQKTYRALLLQKLGPDAGISKADVYFRLGEISLKQGDAMKAKSMLERAIVEGGDHPEAKALLASIG